MAHKLEEKTKTLATSKVEDAAQVPEPSSHSDLVKEITLRIPLPIAIPVLALIAIAVVAVLFAVFLMSITHEQAPPVALALSVNILAAATYAASKPKMTGRTIAELAILVIYPIALAVVLVNLGVGASATTHAEGDTPAPGAAAAAESVELGASDLQFSTNELSFPADEDVLLTFDNTDSAPHNLSIYESDTLEEDFFIGSNVEPGQSIDYEIPPLAAGAYYYRCDLHPTMEGRVTVS